MFKKAVLVAAMCVELVVATPVIASQTSDFVTEMVGALQFMVGKQEGSDFTIVSIKAEDEVLVLRVDGPKGWRRDKSAEELSELFVSGFCEKGSELFDKGVKIRVETTEDTGSGLMVGPNSDHCPA
ncbi:MAG: hypothetical protein WBL74_03500 [Novosphingobium sp.]|uniref:hypothetical protein n=1 Tax=Novosphingobium sp. TaxID=1874826 RepID=UPI003C7C8DD7